MLVYYLFVNCYFKNREGDPRDWTSGTRAIRATRGTGGPVGLGKGGISGIQGVPGWAQEPEGTQGPGSLESDEGPRGAQRAKRVRKQSASHPPQQGPQRHVEVRQVVRSSLKYKNGGPGSIITKTCFSAIICSFWSHRVSESKQ